MIYPSHLIQGSNVSTIARRLEGWAALAAQAHPMFLVLTGDKIGPDAGPRLCNFP